MEPWQKIGMSRSSWYRYGKPAAKPEGWNPGKGGGMWRGNHTEGRAFTSVNVDKELWIKGRIRALELGVPMIKFVEDALRRHLATK